MKSLMSGRNHPASDANPGTVGEDGDSDEHAQQRKHNGHGLLLGEPGREDDVPVAIALDAGTAAPTYVK